MRATRDEAGAGDGPPLLAAPDAWEAPGAFGVGEELASGREPARGRTLARRGGAVLVAVAAGLAALGLGGPELLDSSGLRGRPPAAPPAPPSSSSVDALAWAPRGDLAGDPDLLATATALAADGRAAALFATALPDGSRLVLVGGARPGRPAGAEAVVDVTAVHLPVTGAPVLTPAGSWQGPGDVLLWAGRGADGRTHAVVVGEPRLLVAEISGWIYYRPDGVARRPWRILGSSTGAVVTDLGTDTDPVVAVRRSDAGGGYPRVVPVSGLAPPDPADVAVAGLDGPGYRGPEPAALRRLLVEATRPVLDLATTRVEVLWSGTVGPEEPAALLLLTRADNARLQLLLGHSPASGTYAQELRRVPWDVAGLIPWVFERGERGTSVLLLNPSGAGTATISVPGRAPRRVPIGPDGVARLGLEDSAGAAIPDGEITITDPAGREVVTAPVLDRMSIEELLALDR